MALKFSQLFLFLMILHYQFGHTKFHEKDDTNIFEIQ